MKVFCTIILVTISSAHAALTCNQSSGGFNATHETITVYEDAQIATYVHEWSMMTRVGERTNSSDAAYSMQKLKNESWKLTKTSGRDTLPAVMFLKKTKVESNEFCSPYWSCQKFNLKLTNAQGEEVMSCQTGFQGIEL